MCLGLVYCIQYEASMINHLGKRDRYSKKEKWLPFKNNNHIYQIYSVHTLGVHEDMKFL